MWCVPSPACCAPDRRVLCALSSPAVAPAPPTPQLQRFQSAPVKASAAPARAPVVAPRRASDDVGSSAEPAADRPGQHAQGAGGGSPETPVSQPRHPPLRRSYTTPVRRPQRDANPLGVTLERKAQQQQLPVWQARAAQAHTLLLSCFAVVVGACIAAGTPLHINRNPLTCCGLACWRHSRQRTPRVLARCPATRRLTISKPVAHGVVQLDQHGRSV